MIRLFRVLFRCLTATLKTQRELALENLDLCHQLAVPLATSHGRPSMTDLDRAAVPSAPILEFFSATVGA